VAVAELLAVLGSNAAELAVAVSVIVLRGRSVAFTFTTNVSVMKLPEARPFTVQVTVPVPPGAGPVQDPALMLTLNPVFLLESPQVIPFRDELSCKFRVRPRLLCNIQHDAVHEQFIQSSL
jgi:hypothetical protein